MNTEIIVSLGEHETTSLKHAFAPAVLAAEQYEAYALSENDIDAFLALQTYGQAKAAESGTAHFIKPRTRAQLEAHLQSGMPILGVRHVPTGAHVAHALMTDPVNPASQYLAGYPLAPGDRIVQSFFIHPDHRFSALDANVRNVCHPASLLYGSLGALAREDGGIRMIAKIADDNGPSLKSFARAGFGETLAHGLDPVHGHRVRYVAAPVLPSMAVQYVIANDRMDGPCHG